MKRKRRQLFEVLPFHWVPYFKFAFRAGLRPGEQIGLKPEDIDWGKGTLYIRRAVTLDESGKRTTGETKNKYSRRVIRLTPSMLEPLREQAKIHKQFDCEYFFCTPNGCQLHLSNLRKKVWVPALKKAGLVVRAMKQTRHTFATLALSYGESPLWIAKIMGHRDTEMIIKVYSRYVENARGTEDGGSWMPFTEERTAIKSRRE